MEENLIALSAKVGIVLAGIAIVAMITGTTGPMSKRSKKPRVPVGSGNRWVTGEVSGGITSGAHLIGSSFPG